MPHTDPPDQPSRSHHHSHSHKHKHESRPHRHREPVILNVYDMMRLNEFTTPLGLGVFHSGVEVYGVEFAYAGHTSAESGIFEIRPRDLRELGGQFQFRESIHMGRTRYNCEEVLEIIEELGQRFRGDRYHLTTNNCNHFSNALTRALVGRSIPGWVNRLAHIFSHVPLLQRCLPKYMLRPISELLEEEHDEDEEPKEPTPSKVNVPELD